MEGGCQASDGLGGVPVCVQGGGRGARVVNPEGNGVDS